MSQGHKKRIVKNCAICGKFFSIPPCYNDRVKCCGRECGYKLLSKVHRGKNHHNWQGKRRKSNCETCGKEILSILHPKTGWKKFCSRKCKGAKHSLAVEGENNGRWRNGKANEPYPAGFNNRLKREIRARDNHTCQLCGTREADMDRRLDVHHIDYIKSNLSKSNLISLCRACNSRVNHNRSRWKSKLSKLTEGPTIR